MIKIENIHKSFQGKEILKGVSSTFQQGKTNLIIGRSGSGKTVLLKSIVGLYDIDEGDIWYNDKNFNRLEHSEKKKVRQNIGMLFQGSALFDSKTVEQNVMFPLDMFTNLSFQEKLERVNFCLERVNIVNSNHLFPDEISGGMQKRVAIARAIALNPQFLLCDEPNSGLDPQTAIVIDNLIKEITEEYNMTTIINTHDMNSVLEHGDNIIFIHNGEKAWEGNRDEILHSENKDLQDFIFASSLFKRIKELS